MANWQGIARTNYFNVTDPEAFKARMAEIGSVTVAEDVNGTFALIAENGNWPDHIEHDVGGDDEVFIEDEAVDIVNEVVSFLRPDSIVVFTEAGYEGERYVSGQSLAYNANGEYIEVNLSDIYDLAKAKWGIEPTRAEY